MERILALFLLFGFFNFVNAQTEVGGAVEGRWTIEDSPYLAVENLSLAANRALVIDPGVVVLFNADVMFEARGRLLAVGTEEDSIYFAWRQEDQRWRGLRMFNASPESRLSYCVFMGSTSQGEWEQESARGGALYLRNTNIEVSHCLFTLNIATGEGAGIHAYECSPTIIFNEFNRNHSNLNAAAVCLRFSNSIVSDNLMINGTTGWGPGGMIIWNSNPTIERNYIMYNSSNLDWGCGIYIGDRCDPIIRNNVIVHNDGGAIYAGPSMNVRNFDNNTIAFNTGRCGILLYSNTRLALRNCILWRNGDQEMWCHQNSSSFAEYCDISNVENEDINQGEGVFDQDPVFLDPDNDDYHLAADSPCIDAGDPNFDRDPDGTISDIGAFPFDLGEGDAAIEYEPEELVAEESGEYVINLANVGDVDLWFRCSLICDWAAADPLNGVIVPEGDEDIFITIDAEGMEIGVYQTVLRLVTNVRAQRMFEIPITLAVEAGSAPRFQDLPDRIRCQETDTLLIPILALDADGDRLQIECQSPDLPHRFSFVDRGNGAGLFTWVTNYNDAGVYHATFSVRDDFWIINRQVEITVSNLNRPPVIVSHLPDLELFEDSAPRVVSPLNQIFRDPDSDSLSYEFNLSAGLECWVSEQGNLICQTLRNFNGNAQVVVIANDSLDSIADTMDVVVFNVNDPPSAFTLISPSGEDRVDSFPEARFLWHRSVDVVEDSSVNYAIGFSFNHQARWFYGLTDTSISVSRQVVSSDPQLPTDVQWQVWAYDGTDSIACEQPFTCHIEPLAAGSEEKITPLEYRLAEPYPNPFNSRLEIQYDTPREGWALLAVYDASGKEVTRLVDENITAGSRKSSLNADSLPTGLYIIRMQTPEKAFIRKAILVR